MTAQPQPLPLSSQPWKPLPYMKKAVKFLLEHAASALFLDPGLRKTSITLAALKLLMERKLVAKVLIIAPLKDSNFRADSVDRVAAAAREVFKLHGHEDRLRIEHPDCDHDFPTEMRQQAYELFDRVLR